LGKGITVTAFTQNELPEVYDIAAAPPATAYTVPLASTDAVAAEEVDQLPPVMDVDRAVVAPSQTDEAPVIH
jgi:hypothetical protein